MTPAPGPPPAPAGSGAGPDGGNGSGGRVERRHATCVAWLGRGVLLLGPSGAGKSSLALRLIEAGFGLVADDLVELERPGGPASGAAVLARPAALPGRIEVRGWGVVRLPHATRAAVALVARLGGPAAPERMPAPAGLRETLLGCPVPALDLDARSPDAPARVRLALLAAPPAAAP